ncbi:hypothetical protein KGQ64_18235, partial [bacterium]|nr:hypothetical protein [bacterium]
MLRGRALAPEVVGLLPQVRLCRRDGLLDSRVFAGDATHAFDDGFRGQAFPVTPESRQPGFSSQGLDRLLAVGNLFRAPRKVGECL